MMDEGLAPRRAPDAETARKGRWLQRLLVSFLALGTLVVLAGLLAPQSQVGQTVGVNLVTVVVLALLILLNRQGFVTAAAGALVVLLVGTMIAPALLLKVGLTLALAEPALFVIVIGTAGVFLSWRVVPVVVAGLSVLTFWYYLASSVPALVAYRSSDPDGIATLGFVLPVLFVATGALSWLSSRLIGDTLADLRRRNAELAAANRDLAAQRGREQDLGQNIGTLAGELSAVSTRQASGVATQADSINQVVSSVAELHTAADQIAALAGEVSQAADSALSSVQRGQDMVVRSREAVQRNRAQVQAVIGGMTELDRLTARIAQFVNSIRDLSDETQLLALNATIEAAGAGAVGRRFGVVAAEVQSLSHRSNEVVDQIRALIGDLHQAGQRTLAATQGSSGVADEVERLADEVWGAQEQVVSAVQRTTELVHLISTATSQQTTATAQMTHTMRQIADVAHATSEDTTALERAIVEMTRSATLLNSAMTEF